MDNLDKRIENTFDFKEIQKCTIEIVSRTISMNSTEEEKRRAEIIQDKMLKVFQKYPNQKVNVLAKIIKLSSNASNSFSMSSRKVYEKLVKNPQMGKIAIVGINSFIKMPVNFIMAASGKKDKFKFFNETQEALNWINKK